MAQRMTLLEQTIREAVHAAKGDAEDAKKRFWRAVKEDELPFLREFVELMQGMPHGPEMLKAASEALALAGGDTERLDQIIRELTDPREFPKLSRQLLMELAKRAAPWVNGLIDTYAAKYRKESQP